MRAVGGGVGGVGGRNGVGRRRLRGRWEGLGGQGWVGGGRGVGGGVGWSGTEVVTREGVWGGQGRGDDKKFEAGGREGDGVGGGG
jgi:hypothetical protein